MRNVYLLDCTLRDGGYVNEWGFGEETIRGYGRKIAMTGVEFFEVGFIKGDVNDPGKTVFPDVESIAPMICPKSPNMKYVAMLDMSDPVPIDRISPYSGESVDGIRVIFKKDRVEDAYRYCERIQELGYFVSVNVVGTDLYSDSEFIGVINKFNRLHPFALSIVDTFGLIKKRHFMRLAYLADNNLDDGIALAYHAHNNLQQAFGNAEALVEMNTKRDLIVDACVFGMGRGAGNLNLELFAEYMNENYGTDYKIEPMLEIMDEYLNDIYRTRFWGYSLPLYLSATAGCHPNYAIYLAEKNTLTVKSFNEILRGMSPDDRAVFSKGRAERYYREYQENYVDDRRAVAELAERIGGRDILVLAPGKTLRSHLETVREASGGAVKIAANFLAEEFSPDYIFSSNMRRFARIQGRTDAECIITSNMKDALQRDYVVNFSSYASKRADIIDNSVLMLLRLLLSMGTRRVSIAGMDGYSGDASAYYDSRLDHDFSGEAARRNALISEDLREIGRHMDLTFVTPTVYEV